MFYNLGYLNRQILGNEYDFDPLGVENLGTWSPGAIKLFKGLMKTLIDITVNEDLAAFLVFQRGNAASIIATVSRGPLQ